jgi:hypothetical protein
MNKRAGGDAPSEGAKVTGTFALLNIHKYEETALA